MNKIMRLATTIVMAIVLVATATSVFGGQLITPGSITPTVPNSGSEIQTIGQKIVGILQTVGVILAVVMLIILGIKYMMGSAEEKADYKKTMIPYLVGAVCIFAASALANVIYNFVSGLGSTSGTNP